MLLVGDIQLYQTRPVKKIGAITSPSKGNSEGRFTAYLGCHRTECREVATVSGDYRREEVTIWDAWAEHNGTGYANTYAVHSFHPAPSIISIPASLNDLAKNHLTKAFDLFWNDYASCANRLRIVVEHLLDQFDIPRKAENGKYVDLNFRIGEMTKVRPDQADFLNALRWVGNAGSHDGVVDFDDLLHSFEMLEHVLTELLGDARAAMRAEAQRIIAAKGKAKL